MAHYLVIGGKTQRRFARDGRPVLATAEEAKLPSITLASMAAHVVSTRENEAGEVWKVDGPREVQVAVYLAQSIGETGGAK